MENEIMLKKLLRFVLISFGVLALGFILLVFFAVRAEKNEQILAEQSGFESVSQMEIAQSAGFDTGEGFKQHLAELQAQQEAEAERLALEEEVRGRGFSSIDAMLDAEERGFIKADIEQLAAQAGYSTFASYSEFLQQDRVRFFVDFMEDGYWTSMESVSSCEEAIPIRDFANFTKYEATEVTFFMVPGQNNACHSMSLGCDAIFGTPVTSAVNFEYKTENEFKIVQTVNSCVTKTDISIIDDDTISMLTSVGESCPEAVQRTSNSFREYHRCYFGNKQLDD